MDSHRGGGDQDCCEDAGWFIAPRIIPYEYDVNSPPVPDVSSYNFDPDYFCEVESSDLDDGGQVAFKLVAEGLPDLYLQLYNSHNGYYTHGLEVKHNGETVRDSWI